MQVAQATGIMRRTSLIASAALRLVLGVPHLLGFGQHTPMLALLLLLPLAAVALRYNLHATGWAIVLLDCGVVLLVASHRREAIALQYQLEMIAISLVGLWLGGHRRLSACFSPAAGWRQAFAQRPVARCAPGPSALRAGPGLP
jgi:hypothetical protein